MAFSTSTSSVDVATLRHAVRGSVLAAGEDGWDIERTPWNLAFEQQPALIVVPASSHDVQAAVLFATANGLRVAAQGTGHGVATLGDLSDTVLIRTHELRAVEIDAEARQARVGAGVLWDEVVAPAAEHGLVALHGSSPDVGVVGYTLGGGIGWLSRKHGLAANAVTAIEVVTADGEFHRVDHTHERDLFFALRGGGGNFGVVTAMEFELFPLEQAFAGWLIWDWRESERVLAAWRDWSETAPDEVTSIGRLFQFPPIEQIPEFLRGRNLVVVEVAYLGDEASGRELLAPLLALEPELSTLATMPAAGLMRLHSDPEGNTPAQADGALLSSLPDEAIAAVLAVAGPGSGSPFISFELRQLGGALRRPAERAGAASHIEGEFGLFAVGLPFTPELGKAIEAHLDAVADAVAPWRSAQNYFNFAERHVESESFYTASTHDRLREIRERFDPSDLFQANQRIQPAGSDW
ncbi:MAG TPA: FAD-binding oxidoreductase [Gaiellales bacterium]|jgi:FAD/FMN-containing dehydrogenase